MDGKLISFTTSFTICNEMSIKRNVPARQASLIATMPGQYIEPGLTFYPHVS
jgi:hypothetical protein